MKISHSILSIRRKAGFTMIEIALCLLIIGFGLVAIIGVLPTGLGVQQDNREETIIDQDAAVWMSAIRNGARGFDDLTNYVTSITISSNAPGISGSRTYYATNDLTDGQIIIGLLSTPKYQFQTKGTETITITNSIVAFVRAMSGSAIEKPPQNSEEIRGSGFAYRMVAENTPLPMFWDSTNAPPPQMIALQNNSRELRLLFRWPLLPNNEVGNGRQTFRLLVGGTINPIGSIDGRSVSVFQPSIYQNPQTP
jgi:type II secretory pathway pseudopilin PulG